MQTIKKDFDPLAKVEHAVNHIIVPDRASLELECRFVIDERKAMKKNNRMFTPSETIKLAKFLINKYKKSALSCKIEQSMNLVNTIDNNITRLVFNNGVQIKSKKTYYKKQRIINSFIVIDKPSYKLHLSFEKSIPVFDYSLCNLARAKLRISFNLAPPLNHWRLDITLVKQSNVSKDLKKCKNSMLYKISVDNFIDKAPWEYADFVEFEIEYIGVHKNFSADMLNGAAGVIKDAIDKIALAGLDLKSDVALIDESLTQNTNNAEDLSDYSAMIYKMAKLIRSDANKFKSKRFGLRQLSNQVIELDKNTFIKLIPDISNYYITDKIDGQRCLIYIDENGAYALSDKLNDIGDVADIRSSYIFDTERYNGEYWIFDVLLYAGKNITTLTFNKRMEYFKKAQKIAKEVKGLVIKIKPFIKLTKDFAKLITKLNKKKKPYETDGHVLTPGNESYYHMRVYKYKPINKLSIDFLMKKCPRKLLGIKPYNNKPNETLYILFCGIQYQTYKRLRLETIKHYDEIFPMFHKLPRYFPVQFTPSNAPYMHMYYDKSDEYDGEIGEFIYDSNTRQWSLLRIREDKHDDAKANVYFGNNIAVAESTWMSIINPLIIEKITNSDVYFMQHDNKIYRSSRNYNSFVKSRIFAQYKNMQHVMDLASGKGQDLFRYADNGTGEVLFVEQDGTALQELIQRKYSFAKQNGWRGYNRAQNTDAHMRIWVKQLNLLDKFKNNINKITASMIPTPNNGYDLIVCNMAFNYFTGSIANIKNICAFVAHYLKKKSRFIFTAFDGKAVIKLLNNTREWHSSDKDKRFHIKLLGKDTTLMNCGQKIDVKLPFSGGKFYTEYLVNIDYIEKQFSKFNITLETEERFSAYISDYKHKQYLDNDDKIYTSLYHYYGFYKE